jgi:hypothetical protein
VGKAAEPPKWIKPQLTRAVGEVPAGDDWLHEIKYDGYRMHARLDRGKIQLLTRTSLDWSRQYAFTIDALRSLPAKTAYIDGELCATVQMACRSSSRHIVLEETRVGGSMSYTTNKGVRIHYEVEGEGPPLVLQHGWTHSMEDWHTWGYVGALRDHHRLILIDARGHGESDKPYERSAYALDNLVGDIVAVLDALGLERVHYWGYSRGGWIGYGFVMQAGPRPS